MIKTSMLVALFTYIGAFLISTPSLGNFLEDPPQGPSLEETVYFIKKHIPKECHPKDTTGATGNNPLEILDFDTKKEDKTIKISISYVVRNSNKTPFNIEIKHEFQASEIELPHNNAIFQSDNDNVDAMNIIDGESVDCYEISINCESKSKCVNVTVLAEKEGLDPILQKSTVGNTSLLIPDDISMGERLAQAVYHLLKLGGAKKRLRP